MQEKSQQIREKINKFMKKKSIISGKEEITNLRKKNIEFKE